MADSRGLASDNGRSIITGSFILYNLRYCESFTVASAGKRVLFTCEGPQDSRNRPLTATESDSGSITRHNTSTPLFLLYLLVSWLHTHFHLPFLACNAVLAVVLQILQASGCPLPLNPYRTLATVTLRLGVEPVFQVLPVCKECLEVHPPTTSTDSRCVRCEFPLYKSTLRHDRRARLGAENHRPHLQFPTKSIEAHLREILIIPGMEDVMESWRYKQRTPGKYCDNFDGAVCKTIPGVDGRPFFENPRSHGCTELRIGLSLGVDWYVYFWLLFRWVCC